MIAKLPSGPCKGTLMPDLKPNLAASSKTRRSLSVVLAFLYTSLHRKASARFRLVFTIGSILS